MDGSSISVFEERLLPLTPWVYRDREPSISEEVGVYRWDASKASETIVAWLTA